MHTLLSQVKLINWQHTWPTWPPPLLLIADRSQVMVAAGGQLLSSVIQWSYYLLGRIFFWRQAALALCWTAPVVVNYFAYLLSTADTNVSSVRPWPCPRWPGPQTLI